MPNILIADDEKEIIRLLKIYLNDYNVLEANDGQQALAILNSQQVDLAIIDIMMPRVDGYQVITKIREKSSYIPVIIISAKVTLSDRILGMDIGADDYITKPFEPLEVQAKVRAQLRRQSASAPSSKNETITVGDVTLSISECTVTKGGKTESLTKNEFKVLELLMGNPRRVFTKEQIYESAWYDSDSVDDNTIRVIISRLRDKVGAEHIKTIRGLGYRYEE
ncbi:MAG: response regulator transcription factor [Oscillospiraceae bacterium]|nr:response regulator transcription factor [Oscillospiraceae bacterium]